MNRPEEQALKIVESALAGSITAIHAAHAIRPFLTQHAEFIEQRDIDLIRAIESESDALPTGREREHWHPDSLREKDREMERCARIWQEAMMNACQRIRRILLLRKLIIHLHLNVAERRHVIPVRKSEVLNVIRAIMQADGVFPAEGKHGAAYEGAVLERMQNGARIVLSRTDPIHPEKIVERRVDNYDDLNIAIERFIHIEWSKGIDGIEIESEDENNLFPSPR